MHIEKPTQRKTVQWNSDEINMVIVQQKDDFLKKVLQFQSHPSSNIDVDNSDSDDSESLEGKSEKTIEIETNLKKAKINRVSQRLGNPVNLKEINRRISLKGNINADKDQIIDKEALMKKMQFQEKKEKHCNEGLIFKKDF